MHQPIKVRLKADLTSYHPALKPGIEGVTAGQTGAWSRDSDRFIGVTFPSAGTWDVLWTGLEIIDETYLREEADREAKKWEALKHATNVVQVLGPRGNLMYVSYQYIDQGVGIHASEGFRQSAEKLLQFFEDQGIPVITRKLERQQQ
jgi:hypothetical protein